MSKMFYRYNPTNGLLITAFEGTVDNLSSKAGKVVYALPQNCTDIAPHADVPEGKIQFFDVASKSWRITPDLRGTKVINKETKEIVTWNKLGVIPNEYTTDIPADDRLPYVTWQGTYWDVVGDQRNDLVNAIWDLRKRNRDAECASDIEYNGHVYHVDAISFNDITLAAQEAMLTGDMETTRRWITADDINVQLSGNDFVAIMRLYGARRQRLVFSSNEEWQQDLMKSTDELFTTLKQLQ